MQTFQWCNYTNVDFCTLSDIQNLQCENAIHQDCVPSSLCTPTEEQSLILNCVGNVVFIQAFAGSGKTSTLQMYTKHYRSKKFLYLAFNRSAKEHAEKHFGDNVHCRTIDSLCFEFAHAGNKTIEVLNKSTLKKYYPEECANAKILQNTLSFMACFLENNKYKDVQTAWMSNQGYGRSAYNNAYKLWKDIQQADCPWTTHDFNRKMCLTHSKSVCQILESQYDSILVDESQDLNSTMLEIIAHYGKQKIFVGDVNQAIYSFMGNVNTFSLLTPTDSFMLSTSFRFGQCIAERAQWCIDVKKRLTDRTEPPPSNTLLNYFKTIPRLSVPLDNHTIKSHGKILDTVKNALNESAQESSKDYCESMKTPYTILSRYNSTLFLCAQREVLLGNRTIYWNGRDDYFAKVEAMLPLRKDSKVWNEKKKRAQDDDDLECLNIMRLVEANSVQSIQAIVSRLQECTRQEKEADVVLSTVHKAKGLEWPSVIVSQDISYTIRRLFTKKKMNTEKLIEECNIYYVACTRAQNTLVDLSYNTILSLLKIKM